jgi:hypothetical protein
LKDATAKEETTRALRRGELHQIVPPIENVGQIRTQQIIPFLVAQTVLHG